MSDDFFNDFDESKKAPTAPLIRKAPPPPPAHRPPSASLAGRPTHPTTNYAAENPAVAAASSSVSSRPVTAAGPRPSGTNATNAGASTTQSRSRHQLQQTRTARAVATPRTSTHLMSAGTPVAPAAPANTTTNSAGFYASQSAPTSTMNQPLPTAAAPQQTFQPAVFTPNVQPQQQNPVQTAPGVAASSARPTRAASPFTSQTTATTTTTQAQQGYHSYAQPQPYQQQQTQPVPANDFSGWVNTSAVPAASFSGAMDSAAPAFAGSSMATMSSTPAYFTPQLTSTTSHTSISAGSSYSSDDFLDEPPLLEELGINMEHIMFKTKAVVLPFTRLPFLKNTSSQSHIHDNDTSAIIIQDADLAGPLVFALLLGAELLVTGKLHSFGYIYGLSVFGSGCLALILNLMKGPLGHAYDHTQQQSASLNISMWTTTSILGYALLPVNVLAGVKILFTMMLMQHNATVLLLLQVLGVVTVIWSTMASTRLLEVGCDMRAQRYLIAYPIALLYSAFVLLTIF